MPAPISGLDRLPASSDIHLWADWTELLCLFNSDGRVSKSDLISRSKAREDVGEFDDLPEPAQIGSLDEFADPLSSDPATRNSVADDKRAIRAEDAFAQLVYRESELGGTYPFTISADGQVLVRSEAPTPQQRLYLFLLLASSLRYLHNADGIRSAFTSHFEYVCGMALACYLPASAEVHIFGTTSRVGVDRFTGSLWSKIGTLAGDLRLKIVCDEDDFKAGDSGDNGLDLVAWLPIGDDNKGFLLVFGQCGCSPEWEKKQSESSEDEWSAVLHFNHALVNTMWIPFCYRSADGGWYTNAAISRTILFDRVRILHLLKDVEPFEISDVLPIPVLDACIEYRENPV